MAFFSFVSLFQELWLTFFEGVLQTACFSTVAYLQISLSSSALTTAAIGLPFELSTKQSAEF